MIVESPGADLAIEGVESGPPHYTRLVSVPAAAPWDQQRAALLNARHNSPLPDDQVLIQVKRLGSWRPNEHARFAAAYVRKSDFAGGASFTEDLGGELVAFEFSSSASKTQARRRAIIDLSLGASLIVVILFGGSASVTRRAESEAALGAAQKVDEEAARQERLSARIAKNVSKLSNAGYAGRSGGDLLEDLSWLARSRNSNSVLQSFTWDRGDFVLRSADPTRPLSTAVDAQSERSGATNHIWRVGAPTRGARVAPSDGPHTVSVAPASVAHDGMLAP